MAPPLDFPSASLVIGQTFTGPNGVIWTWDGAKWANGSTIATAYAPLNSPVFTGDPTAPTPPAGDADTSLATTAFVAASTATALHDVGRNTLHNSMFTIAQRGNGPWTVSSSYTVDRWVISVVTDTTSFTRATLADSDRAAIGDEAASFTLSNTFTGNAAAGAVTYMDQKTEGVRRLAGKTVTLSFWAIANPTLKLGVNFVQWFGTGGSPSTAVYAQATGSAVTLATVWTRYAVTFALPSIAGKTLGTNGDDSLYVRLFYSSGANNNANAGNIGVQSGTIQLWGVQLEIGPTATPLEKLDPVTQLQQCQRFFQVGAFSLGGYSGGSIGFNSTYAFPVVFRAIPTITPTYTSQVNCGSSGVTPYAGAAYGPAFYYVATVSTAAGGISLAGAFTASADL